MASTQRIPRCDCKKDAALDLRQARKNRRSARPLSDTSLSELTELLRDLHQSLQEYAPRWYTQAMNDRIREKLADAERS